MIISKINARVSKKTHKFGIEVPNSIKRTKQLDLNTGDNIWCDGIAKDNYNLSVAFKIIEDNESPPPGWTKSIERRMFDVKMDFTRKSRWVKDGHKSPDPETSSYAGVVIRESIHILLTYAALQKFDVMAADIRNKYLQAPTSEKHFIICDTDLNDIEHAGKRAMVVRDLHVGKNTGRDFWMHLHACMDTLGFTSWFSDPDVWMRNFKREYGIAYYEYVLLYADDCLVISDNSENVIREEIGKYFELKKESINPSDMYLVGHMRKVTLDNGVKAWDFGSSQYVQAAVKNFEEHLKKQGKKPLPTKVHMNPLTINYCPDIEISQELNTQDASFYQSLLGILLLIVKLGRVDICVEVSMMSSHIYFPRQGHLDQVFTYLDT